RFGVCRFPSSALVLCLVIALGAVGQFHELSIPIGNVPCVRAFQSPEKHLCGGRIVAASLQRSDYLALMGDVPFPAMEKAFGLLKKLFQGSAVHPAAYQSTSTPGPFFCPWIRFSPRLVGGASRAAETNQ